MITLAQLGIDIESVKNTPAGKGMLAMFNIVEEVTSENQKLLILVQKLRDEIALLKGEQPKPTITGKNQQSSTPSTSSVSSLSSNISSETERKALDDVKKGKNKNKDKKKKRSKKNTLKITRTEKVPVDKSILPEDAIFKGYETSIIQDILIQSEVIEFQKEIFYSPSLKKTFRGQLPQAYQGTFGPTLKSLIIILKTVSNVSEPKIHELLKSLNIQIELSSIDRILNKNQEPFHKEKQEIVKAGLASTKYQHIDDTGCRVNGENCYTQIFCNQWYTAFSTSKRKDRLTIIDILNAGKMSYLFNKETYALLEIMHVPNFMLAEFKKTFKEDVFIDKKEMEEIFQSMDVFSDNKHPIHKTRLQEASAISAYHNQTDIPVVEILMADDAPQFKLITKSLALCWVHDARHYKKLIPAIDYNKEILEIFMKKYWEFYAKLLEYKELPSETLAKELSTEFDTLFSTVTDYADLNNRIEKTKAKKVELLLSLKYPELPLHNNPAELGAR
jgi:hypothetical protein